MNDVGKFSFEEVQTNIADHREWKMTAEYTTGLDWFKQHHPELVAYIRDNLVRSMNISVAESEDLLKFRIKTETTINVSFYSLKKEKTPKEVLGELTQRLGP